MLKKRCSSSIWTVFSFLESTGAEWRNSIYIECKACPYASNQESCPDFLFVPDQEGVPVLLPVSDAEILYSRVIDKSECLTTMSFLVFKELYTAWLTAAAKDKEKCPLLQLQRRAPVDKTPTIGKM